MKWNNQNNLKTLKVSGTGNTLVFESEREKAEVKIRDGDIESVCCVTKDGKTVINQGQVHHIVVGEGNAQRDVYHYLKPGGPAPWMRLGITKHRGNGTWSSLPHPFELNSEPGFEEVFFYLLKGGTQRALQVGKGKWCDGSEVDSTWPVSHQSFSVIPMGYHPVVGEPGVHVSYIWAYLAKKKEWEKI